MITQERIDEIKARDAAATPGPWQWRYYGNRQDPELTAPHSGLLLIMDFVRRGMHGAEPRFAERTLKDRGGIMYAFTHWWKRTTDHVLPPDASFIAHSRQDVTDLLGEVERLSMVSSSQLETIESLRSELASIAVRALSYQVTGCPERVLQDIHAWAKRLSKADVIEHQQLRDAVIEAAKDQHREHSPFTIARIAEEMERNAATRRATEALLDFESAQEGAKP